VSAYQDSRPPEDQPARLCVPRLCSAPQRGGRRGNRHVDDDDMPVQLHRVISRGAPNEALSQQSSSHVMIVVMVVMVVVMVVVVVVVMVVVVVVVVVVALLGER
jgi:Flp pilus assembly protein TadB